MIGKTVAEIIDRGRDYGGIDIVFTDGTALRIDGAGYEDSCVTQSDLTAADREAEEVEKRAQATRDAIAAAARAVREAEEAEAKARLTPEDFASWMDEHRVGWRFRNLMRDEFRASLLDLMKESNRLLFDQLEVKHGVYSAVIPIAGD